MILAVDVSYRKDKAVAAGVLFKAWDDCEPAKELIAQLSEVAAYEPGQFYRRELPCLLELLKQVGYLPEYIIIDGYVYLGCNQLAGLGKHLYDALEEKSVVIGVAKSRFKDTPPDREVFRGNSQRPLYVTAVGISEIEAKGFIARMCGEHRVPMMLKIVDKLSKHLRKPNNNH